jgi:hypothetical protein
VYPIDVGIATECQPFTIVFQVYNASAQELAPPRLVGKNIVGNAGGFAIQLSPSATFAPTLQNPPVAIAPKQTMTLTYQVTVDWTVFVPPSNPLQSSSTDQAGSTVISAATDALKNFVKISSENKIELNAIGALMIALNTWSTWSLLAGSHVYLAQYYSFSLEGDTYFVSDPFTQSEIVPAIFQPHKQDVMIAYYTGVLANFLAPSLPPGANIGSLTSLAAQLDGQSGVAKIMNYYPVTDSDSLCWYQQAFNGCLKFTASQQFSPCDGLVPLVVASYYCGTGSEPAYVCPSANGDQSSPNSGGSVINPSPPPQRKWPTASSTPVITKVEGLVEPAQPVAPLSIGGVPVISSVSPIAPRQTQTITISGNGFGTQNGFKGTSQYLRIQNVTANWDAGYTDDTMIVNVSQWTDTQITVTGFGGDYGLSEEWKLNPSNKVTISVWNAQTGAGPATANVTVGPAN